MIWVGLWCTGQIFFRVLTGFNLNIWETRGIGKLNGMAKHPKLVSDESVLCSVVSGSLWPHGLSARLLCPWGFSRQEYWSGLPCPPAGHPFPTQGSNPGLPHHRRILYHLSHQGSPSILYSHVFLLIRNILFYFLPEPFAANLWFHLTASKSTSSK